MEMVDEQGGFGQRVPKGAHLGLLRFLDMEDLWLKVFEWILDFSKAHKISKHVYGLCAKYGGH